MSQKTEEKKTQTEESYMPMTSSDSIYGKRYVGAKELVTLFVTAEINKFNVEGYLSYFMLNVFGLDSRIIAAFAVANLAWDLINDSIFAYIVDRTRTRFGKFKPWAFATIGPYAVACIALWVTPLFIGDQNWGPLSWQKIVIYCVISIFKETVGTLYNCAVNGLDSTFTPSIDDKAALIAIDNIGGFEKVPVYVMVILLDLAAAGTIGISVENVYIFMGAGTAFISALGMLVHIFVIKERIVQVEEKPKLIDGLRNFFGNKLQVCLSLSNFLSAFGSVGGPFSNLFWLDVMGSASLEVVCGVPAAPLTYISYMYFPKLNKKFSTKTLWIASKAVPQLGWTITFLIGINNLDNLWIMIPALMFAEICFSSVYSLGKIIPQLMQQEIIDYGEWKTGKRTEAMTSFISSLATKLVTQVQNAVSSAVISFIGYEAGVGTVQSMKTKQAIFAMYTVIPIVLGIFSYIPMLFYDLDDKTKTIMYHELTERRNNIIKKSQEKAIISATEEK